MRDSLKELIIIWIKELIIVCITVIICAFIFSTCGIFGF
jgi:hypothetical protein